MDEQPLRRVASRRKKTANDKMTAEPPTTAEETSTTAAGSPTAAAGSPTAAAGSPTAAAGSPTAEGGVASGSSAIANGSSAIAEQQRHHKRQQRNRRQNGTTEGAAKRQRPKIKEQVREPTGNGHNQKGEEPPTLSHCTAAASRPRHSLRGQGNAQRQGKRHNVQPCPREENPKEPEADAEDIPPTKEAKSKP